MATQRIRNRFVPQQPISRQNTRFVENQPLGNYFQSAVPPQTNSNIILPGGKTKPFHYSLGVDSTIPFISLIGGGVSQKVFTWGEMIQVPPGQNVTVKNESYMQGDIQINSGTDYAAKPERISVVVPTTRVNAPPLIFISSDFPADTRRCRRAYLKCQIRNIAAGGPVSFAVFFGKPDKHSFPAVDSATGEQTYTQLFILPTLTEIGELPMGYGSVNINSITPMGLTDQVRFEMTLDDPDFVNSLFMYVLEY